MAAASRGKVRTGSVRSEGKAGAISPWRIAFGLGGCQEVTGDSLPVSPIRRRYHVRTVRLERN